MSIYIVILYSKYALNLNNRWEILANYPGSFANSAGCYFTKRNKNVQSQTEFKLKNKSDTFKKGPSKQIERKTKKKGMKEVIAFKWKVV